MWQHAVTLATNIYRGLVMETGIRGLMMNSYYRSVLVSTAAKRGVPILLLAVVAFSSVMARAGDSPIAEDASVYFIWPKDGAVMKSGKFRLLFGLRNCGVAPAGIEINNTGHHHLIINAELPPFDEEIPADRNHIHFGKGQTETVVDLPSGTHTLQLLFADHYHVPHKMPVFSDKITVTVP